MKYARIVFVFIGCAVLDWVVARTDARYSIYRIKGMQHEKKAN